MFKFIKVKTKIKNILHYRSSGAYIFEVVVFGDLINNINKKEQMSSSIRNYFDKNFGQKGLALNMTYAIFLIATLVVLGWLGTSNFNSDSWGTVSAKSLNLLAIILVGVTGHLLQGPFGNFSNVLFVGLFFFIQRQFTHYTVLTGDKGTDTSGALGDLKSITLILFWAVAVYGILYLMFVFFPNDLIPTADQAYKMMMRQPKMSAPAVVAPATSA